jgi:hypothetical protein
LLLVNFLIWVLGHTLDDFLYDCLLNLPSLRIDFPSYCFLYYCLDTLSGLGWLLLFFYDVCFLSSRTFFNYFLSYSK